MPGELSLSPEDKKEIIEAQREAVRARVREMKLAQEALSRTLSSVSSSAVFSPRGELSGMAANLSVSSARSPSLSGMPPLESTRSGSGRSTRGSVNSSSSSKSLSLSFVGSPFLAEKGEESKIVSLLSSSSSSDDGIQVERVTVDLRKLLGNHVKIFVDDVDVGEIQGDKFVSKDITITSEDAEAMKEKEDVESEAEGEKEKMDVSMGQVFGGPSYQE